MQSDGNSEELNMELSANEQAEIDASTKAATDAAQAAAAAAKAAEGAKAAADAQDPVREALSKTTAALNGVISIKTLIRLRASVSAKSGKMGVRKAQVARMTTMLIVIASCTVIYVIFVGLVNQSVYYPWYLGSTWLVYNMLLNVISLILTISMYQNVTKNMDKKKSSSRTTESGELSKQRSSTLDVTAVTRTSSTTELETPH